MDRQSKEDPIVSVIIPSFRRPMDLARCCSSLVKQNFEDFEVLLVIREEDLETQAMLEKQQFDKRFRTEIIDESGLIFALNVGLRYANGKFVVFTDDDSEAPENWLSSIIRHFDSHPKCGGIGGRDILVNLPPQFSNPAPVNQVGTISGTGKLYGNHHCPIEVEYIIVDVLKGVNMSFRKELVDGCKIGDGLRGSGAQVGSEYSLIANVKHMGFQLHFVRNVQIKHHVAPRMDKDNRKDRLSEFAYDSSYNIHYAITRHSQSKFLLIALLRSLLIGNKQQPGLFGILIWRSESPIVTFKHLLMSIRGTLVGFADRQFYQS